MKEIFEKSRNEYRIAEKIERGISRALRENNKHFESLPPDYWRYDQYNDFSLITASFLWYDLQPNPSLFHSDPPKKVLAIARIINQEVEHTHNEKPKGNYKEWRNRRYERSRLIELANQRGVKPPFLFPEVRDDFENWLELSGLRPEDTEEFTHGGYRAIAIMARVLKRTHKGMNDVVQAILGEAEELSRHEDLNTRGVSRSNLYTLIKNGEFFLKNS